jgi:hypothetical protein
MRRLDKIMISHETPVSLLEDSVSFNDYQYCLVHLCDEVEEYRNWFTGRFKAKYPNGEILLDNSIFELRESFDAEKFAVWAEKINPNYYVVPDVLEGYEGTIEKFEEFKKNYSGIPGAAIGVVQGKTWTEVLDCYKYMSEKADYIAFSFDLSMYDVTGYGTDRLNLCVTGRQECIKRLISEGAWNYNKPHHLFGCALAKEFRWYRENNIVGIRSLDTSNPVVAGIKGIPYNGTLGLTEKPSQKLFTMINHEVNDDERELILYNAAKFREIVHGEEW